MALLTRWNPAGEMLSLKQAMDRLFDDSFVNPAGWLTIANGQALPAIDMYQTTDDIVVSAALPGMSQDDVEITLTGQTLSLRGEFRTPEYVNDQNVVYQERRYGTFHRQIPLPVRVDGDSAQATFESGVLTLRIPKAPEVKPRHIEIKPAHQLS